MTLLLEGLVVALVGIFELVGLVALARYTEATRETNPPAQANSTLVASEDGRDYWWVKWEGSCSVWEIQKVGERRVNSFEYEAGIGEGENCRVVHIRPHIASTRQPGVRPTGGH